MVWDLIVVDIDFNKDDHIFQVIGEFVENGRYHFAGPAPRGEKVYHY